jgi:hypothetical protein
MLKVEKPLRIARAKHNCHENECQRDGHALSHWQLLFAKRGQKEWALVISTLLRNHVQGERRLPLRARHSSALMTLGSGQSPDSSVVDSPLKRARWI